MFSLDANVVIDVFRRPKADFRSRLLKARADKQIVLSSIVLFELSFGITKGTSPHGRERLTQFMRGVVEVVEFNAEDAEAAGLLRGYLEARGNKIGPYDTLLAAQAQRRGHTLVTSNTREFSRVPNLAIENWRT